MAMSHSKACAVPSKTVLLKLFSCVCLLASMARSVNCLGQKKAVQVHLIGAHCAGENVKRRTGPFQRKSQKTVLLKRVLAKSATISSNVWPALLWYSCHPLSAVMGQPLGGFSTCRRSLTTLIMVPATGMSILALSPKHPRRAVQIPSLITPCAAKCSMGPQFW